MKYFTIFLFLINALCVHSQENAIYVSSGGNDQYAGTKEKPVATFEKAKDLVRKLKNQQVSEDTITVFLREGVYRLKRGIVITADDGGTEKSPVIYRSYEGENVVISGALPIDNYKFLAENPVLLGKETGKGSGIIEIDLQKVGLSEFKKLRLSGFNGEEASKNFTLREVYFNGKSMPLSRWPNQGYSKYAGIVTDTSESQEKIGIVYENPHISGWRDEPNILLHGYWKYLWADAYEHVSRIDTLNKVIWLTPPYNHYKFQKGNPFAAYNVIAEIDRPGEWAYDYQQKKIYFYPPGVITSGSLELSICEDPLFVLNNTQWITLKDIQIEMGAHDGLQIINSDHIQLDNCSIHGFARDGIVMIEGTNNTISSCDIYDMGRGGIKVSGGNRVTLEKSGFLIENCHIHHLSRIDRTYTPGIWVDGVGTTISNCNIHDVPSSAMRINGNDNLVEYNEMYHVVTESNDQGAIDMWGDPTYRGNVFRYNYIHDVGPHGEDEVNAYSGHLSIRAGIRFDDAISGNLIYGNIFRNCSDGRFGAIQIHGGKDNLIRNNLFYQCTAGISFSPWNKERWIGFMKKFDVFLEQNRKLYTAHYPELTRLFEDINKNTVIQNIFLQCDSTTLRQPEAVVWRDNISKINENSDIADIKNNNYSLENISEDVKKIGFKPIPFEKIGLKRKHKN